MSPNAPVAPADLSLDAQHAAFVQNKFLAMPIAGAVAWTAIGVVGALAPLSVAVWAVWIGTGMIFYLGLAIARLTGEDLLGRERRSDFFDRVFLLATGSSLLVFAVAVPFFLVEPTSLPLSVGVLSGLMWLPFSGLIRHWVGVFHGVTRTVGIVAVWYPVPGRPVRGRPRRHRRCLPRVDRRALPAVCGGLCGRPSRPGRYRVATRRTSRKMTSSTRSFVNSEPVKATPHSWRSMPNRASARTDAGETSARSAPNAIVRVWPRRVSAPSMRAESATVGSTDV